MRRYSLNIASGVGHYSRAVGRYWSKLCTSAKRGRLQSILHGGNNSPPNVSRRGMMPVPRRCGAFLPGFFEDAQNLLYGFCAPRTCSTRVERLAVEQVCAQHHKTQRRPPVFLAESERLIANRFLELSNSKDRTFERKKVNLADCGQIPSCNFWPGCASKNEGLTGE
jgi:hypothetical protein